jgi:hypothetical protein
MLRELKHAIRRRIPGPYDRAVNFKRWLQDPYERLLCRIGQKTDWRVASGPFAGMRYIRRNYWDRWAPRLIGSYEEELHPEFERLLGPSIRHVVNIGSFEGYYSVGLALRLPQANVIAYEMSPVKRRWCEELATLNGVRERIEIRELCTAEALAENKIDSAMVVCDCEGAEEDILNPAIVPWLSNSTLIVELHDCYRPNVTQILTNRFKSSHKLRIIRGAPRDPTRYPVLADETPENARLAIAEPRVTADGRVVETPWGVWTPRGDDDA